MGQGLANLAQVSTGLVTLIGAVAAGFFFWRRREYAPRVQFDLGMRIVGERQHELFIELTAIIRNVGYVRYRIKSLTFSVRGLGENDPWNKDENKNNQISFPREIGDARQSWYPEAWNKPAKLGATPGTFVEPGVIQIYPYNIRISSEYAYLLVYAHMDYAESKDDHVAIITKSIAELRAAYLEATE
jgi:hypothetical protein